MDDLVLEVKQLIIDCLDLEDISPEDIATEGPLFGENDGLGLDSIDALELGLAIDQTYDVKLDPDSEASREHFRSVATLVRLIVESRTE